MSTLKIGVLIPREGPAGIWAPSCEASAILAAAEINTLGGINRQAIELIIRDSGHSDRSAVAAAQSMQQLDGAQAVVAMVPSSARRPIRDAIRGDVPLVYTPQFEGSERHSGVITIGETASELLAPAIHWLVSAKRASRFFLLGNDYLWPRRSMAEARQLICDQGGSVAGGLEIPFGFDDYDFLMEAIEKSKAHVVMTWLLGHEAVVFNRAFASSGMAARVLRFSTAIDETILYAIGADCTENLYVASAYFLNLRSRNNDVFLEKYYQYFGGLPPPPNSFGESLYEGIHCLAGLASAASTLRASDLRRRVGRSPQQRTARGFERDVATGNRHPIHIAVADGHDFRLLTTP